MSNFSTKPKLPLVNKEPVPKQALLRAEFSPPMAALSHSVTRGHSQAVGPPSVFCSLDWDWRVPVKRAHLDGYWLQVPHHMGWMSLTDDSWLSLQWVIQSSKSVPKMEAEVFNELILKWHTITATICSCTQTNPSRVEEILTTWGPGVGNHRGLQRLPSYSNSPFLWEYTQAPPMFPQSFIPYQLKSRSYVLVWVSEYSSGIVLGFSIVFPWLYGIHTWRAKLSVCPLPLSVVGQTKEKL